MEWRALFSKRRLSHGGIFQDASHQAQRSSFERDWDRILFSSAFRRMHDKTQVFPLPDNDVVHSRLTHSLEVASIGRSLGKTAGRTILERHPELTSHVDLHDLGDIVAAGCLAHDIGNPPFGHAGESAIASYFQGEGAAALAGMTAPQRADFEAFEGNAQGFRILTRLQLEADGGLNLTAASLAAFTKYPREAGAALRLPGQVATKKHGFFQPEREVFAALAEEVGLARLQDPARGASWARHPLAFLVEAADDICYSMLDIEDGARLGYVDAEEAQELLVALARHSGLIAQERLASFSDRMTRIGYLRALAIGQMIEECAQVFVDGERELLAGTMAVSLAEAVPHAAELRALQQLAKEKCYQAPDVLEIEMAGYRALGGLLAMFVPAVTGAEGSGEGGADGAPAQGPPRNAHQEKAHTLLRMRGVQTEHASRYERILRVTDYVSGMTDRHALATYRRLTGIAIPGRAG